MVVVLVFLLFLLVALHKVRPDGAVVVGRRGGDHRSGLHPVAELDRVRGEGGRVVQAGAALGEEGEALGPLAQGGGPADGADVIPEDGPVASETEREQRTAGT